MKSLKLKTFAISTFLPCTLRFRHAIYDGRHPKIQNNLHPNQLLCFWKLSAENIQIITIGANKRNFGRKTSALLIITASATVAVMLLSMAFIILIFPQYSRNWFHILWFSMLYHHHVFQSHPHMNVSVWGWCYKIIKIIIKTWNVDEEEKKTSEIAKKAQHIRVHSRKHAAKEKSRQPQIVGRSILSGLFFFFAS